ncbi:hypothetical protein CK203_093174 [Vitis vinifera]|uniref:Retrotransposon gag domain-containing protein n=1 Tax=Vitis vinifera TaxID=29760 RepID=A0A438D6M2_VITVI|nr:hypothetical protein CK203_093174 [Vitis vinifera]
MCGGDDHLAWKHPVSLETCRGLRTIEGLLYSVVDFLLKLPDICRKLEAEHLKMKANFAALRDNLLLRSDFAALCVHMRNLADLVFTCELDEGLGFLSLGVRKVVNLKRFKSPGPTLGKASDLRPWRFTSLSLASLWELLTGNPRLKIILKWQMLGERHEPLQDASVINFVDYSLNQGAPAGHESTKTPSGRIRRVYLTDLDSPLWIRVRGRLSIVSDQSDQRSDQRNMDSQIVTIDQFAAAMASIQEAIANLVLPPPPPSQSVPQAIPFTLHSQIEVALPSVTSPIPTSEDHTHWLVCRPSFRMPEIERYTGIGCHRIHLRLYSTVMRAHELDEAQMVMLFPMSLSGVAQRWFTSLDVSRQEGIARGLWPESSSTDSKRKKPSGGHRSGDVGVISSIGMRSLRHYWPVGQTSGFYYPPSPHVQYSPLAPSRPMTPTYLHPVSQPVFVTHVTERPPAPYTRPELRRPPLMFRGHHVSLLSWGSGHDTDHCNALRHAIQDLIDQGWLTWGSQDTFVPFTLWPEDDDSEGKEIQIVTRNRRIAQPPPLAIRVETTTTPKRLIHMMTAGRATCIVFSNDDLPPEGSDHVRPLYITVGCLGRRVPSVLLDNGSALNVLRIPTSFNLLLGRPWIHRARAIPSSLHQKISHSEDDLFLTGFTFDEIQTLEIEDFHRDFVAMSFDQHSSTVVLDMMRGMTFLPGMGLGRRQQGPSEFIAAIDHDMTFGLRMSLADYFVRGSKIRPRVEEVHSVVHTDREIELQHLFHQL